MRIVLYLTAVEQGLNLPYASNDIYNYVQSDRKASVRTKVSAPKVIDVTKLGQQLVR